MSQQSSISDDQGSFQGLLSNIVKREIPGCRDLISCRRLSGGASQETYELVIDTESGQQKRAMRRAPGGDQIATQAGRAGLALEARLFQQALAAKIPVPKIDYILVPEDGIGDGFIMEWIEGETLGARIVRSDKFATIRPKLAFQCGQILARIHAMDTTGLGLSDQNHLPPKKFIESTWDRYKAFNVPMPMIDYTGRWLLENLPTDNELSLVHGDFRNGNLMIDRDHGVVAVLDWEQAHIGDPFRDLGFITTNSWRFGRTDLPVGGFGTYEDMLAGYESVTGKPVDLKKVLYWEVFGSFWWAVGCLGMAQMYREGVDASVERPAIGRRSSECQIDCVNLLIPGPVSLPKPDTKPGFSNMPRSDELIESVRDFLRQDVMDETEGRTNFLARVGANSLDIILREMEFGPSVLAWEEQVLSQLTGSSGSIDELRWQLVKNLRNNAITLDNTELQSYLRQSVVSMVSIDQPNYSGLKTAIDSHKKADKPS